MPGIQLPGGIKLDFDAKIEDLKCKAGGRRKRTACKTVSAADAPAFRNGQIARYLVSERAADFQEAFGLPVTGDIDTVSQFSGLSYAEIAELHTGAFVPQCLAIEANRHTCHPEDSPGRDFYNAARADFVGRLRTGKIAWRRAPRGGSGGTDPIPPTTPGTPGVPQRPEKDNAPMLIALAAIAFLVVAKS